MYKEIIICIIVIFVILFIDNKTQKFTKDRVDDLKLELSTLKWHLISQSEEEVKKKTDLIHSKIKDYHRKLAFYMEHKELEKIELSFISCKSYIESNEHSLAINEIDKTIFILEHINDKYLFNLDNIF